MSVVFLAALLPALSTVVVTSIVSPVGGEITHPLGQPLLNLQAGFLDNGGRVQTVTDASTE